MCNALEGFVCLGLWLRKILFFLSEKGVEKVSFLKKCTLIVVSFILCPTKSILII